jgi:hypothetical protein
MTTHLEPALRSLPAPRWTTRQAIVFDWYDGPREGVCALSNPPGEFRFELLDERPTADDLDDRLYRVSALPAGSVDEIVSALHDLGGPTGPVWVPVWKFPTDEARQQAERCLESVLVRGQPTPLVIRTPDMLRFLGCWQGDLSGPNGSDWFTALGIPEGAHDG